MLPCVGISASAGLQYAPDEILVTFQEELTEADCRAAMSSAGHEVLKRFHFARSPRSRQNRRYLVRIRSGRTVEEALDEVLKLTGVEAAQPNYIYRALQPPDDTYYDLQWGLENAGGDAAHTAYGLPGPDPWVTGKDIGWESAHAILEGMTLDTVIVCVLDTGIDLDHPDLAGMFWINPDEVEGNGADDDSNGLIDDYHGWDYVSDDSNPDDEDGHGTHVAGTIGAVIDNGLGVAGTANNVRLMALRVLDSEGSGYTSDLIDGIHYAIDEGAQVINMSWGGADYDPVLEDALTDALDAGIPIPCAAGNDHSDNDVTPHYPSSYGMENIISVAASSPWGSEASFSNYGRVSVDIAAPGDQTISTTRTDGEAGIPSIDYQIAVPTADAPRSWSGTSMASPYVAAAAALLYGAGDELWPASWSTWTAIERMTAVRDRILDRSSRWPALSGTTVTDGHLDLGSLLEDDIVPPEPCYQFEAVGVGRDLLTLRWTAPGDDGAVGTANYYDLRYHQGSEYDIWLGTPAGGVWTPSPGGLFDEVTITDLQPGTQYAFGIVAIDNAGNQSPLTTLTVTTLPLLVFSSDDMESGLNGWTAEGTWDLTTEAWHSSDHAWSDSPGGPYGAERNTSLTSPEVLTNGSTLQVTYWQRYDLEDGADFGYLEARSSVGGIWGGWMPVLSFTGTDLGWHSVSAALPVTGDEVQIRFRLESNASVEADGWYVDDVSVHVLVRPPADTPLFEDTFADNDCSNWVLSGSWDCDSDALCDSPGADYDSNTRASATLASPLSFEGALAVEFALEFRSFDYEQDYDFLFFEYSLDGLNWRKIDRLTGSQAGTHTFELDHLAGMPAVWFRLVSLTDYQGPHGGVALDQAIPRVDGGPECEGDPDCSDGNFCNGAESCDGGVGLCLPGTPPVCDDGDPCTADSCDPVLGCQNIPPPLPGEVRSLVVDPALLSWDPEPDATGYDIVQGDLALLLSRGGDFTAATTACLDDDRNITDIPISGAPTSGQGFWFLVRGMNCAANGSYDTGSASQVGSRDSEIDASVSSCP